MTLRPEPRWPASLALLVVRRALRRAAEPAGGRPAAGSLPVLIALPLDPAVGAPGIATPTSRRGSGTLTIVLIALITLANVASMGLLVHHLLVANVSQGRNLIYSAVAVWLTNVIVYGLWFWEIDRGGPHRARRRATDCCPTSSSPRWRTRHWRPRTGGRSFTDYLYTSFANGTSFAPADAMPLTLRMKALFATESVVSLVTIAVVAARAVNILR